MKQINEKLRELKTKTKEDLKYYKYYSDSTNTIYQWYDLMEEKIKVDYYNSLKNIQRDCTLNNLGMEGRGIPESGEKDVKEIIEQFKTLLKTEPLFKIAIKLNNDFLK